MKVAKMPLNEFMGRVAERFSPLMPTRVDFPSATIRLQAGESPHGTIAEFVIVVQMETNEMHQWITGNQVEEKEAAPSAIFVSDSYIMDGYFILTSMVKMSIVRMKFHTTGEALAYAEHHRLKGYEPTRIHQDNPDDPWFEGKLGEKPTIENNLLLALNSTQKMAIMKTFDS